MRDGGRGELALRQRIERAAVFGNAFRRALAHGLERVGVLRIGGQIDEFVGIVFQVVQELVIPMIEVADVFELFVAQAFKRRDAIPHGEVFVKRFGSPIGRFPFGDDGLQTAPLITFRHFDARPIEKRRGQVEIEREGIGDLASLRLGHARIGHDQRHAERFLVVRPLAGQTAIAHVIAVVGGVNDDRVVGESGCLRALS